MSLVLKKDRFWESPYLTPTGEHRIFANADELAAACINYFEWVQDNPLYECRVFCNQGEVITEDVPKKRVMTMRGLHLHLGISRQKWSDWKTEGGEYTPVVIWASDVVYTDKFEGAAAGILSPQFIARDLGLADKHDHSSSDGTMSPPKDLSHVTTEDLKAIREKLYGS